jgi:hypothetical protein
MGIGLSLSKRRQEQVRKKEESKLELLVRNRPLDLDGFFDKLWLKAITREQLTEVLLDEYRGGNLSIEQLEKLIRTVYTSMR